MCAPASMQLIHAYQVINHHTATAGAGPLLFYFTYLNKCKIKLNRKESVCMFMPMWVRESYPSFLLPRKKIKIPLVLTFQ